MRYFDGVRSTSDKRLPDTETLEGVDWLGDSNTVKHFLCMAESVTRHAQISQHTEWELLNCGIDTLDLGFYVSWGDVWEDLKDIFDDRKERAKGTDGILIEPQNGRNHLFLPSGKAPNYRYHLQYPEYHVYIAISANPRLKTPNIYISCLSEALQQFYLKDLVHLIEEDIRSMGGSVNNIKPSRLDLCADFRIPDGLTVDFIKSHMISRSNETSQYLKGDALETFYIGGTKADIKARIYDKGKEIQIKHTEDRWKAVWKTDDIENIWRIEFQIRRPILKQFHINTLENLTEKIASLWKYLTKDWLSLRHPDNENQTRRKVIAGWRKVQNCGVLFGKYIEMNRQYRLKPKADSEWYKARIRSHVIKIAAIHGITDIGRAFQRIFDDCLLGYRNINFSEEVKKTAIKLGITTNDEVKQQINVIGQKIKETEERIH
ncbi:MAG: Replication initiation factor [Syntrophus sp. PtaU1.Bin005]|nr:MAG: Replication initiation factor [Syntrophus sp. PtaU1.Bin005]